MANKIEKLALELSEETAKAQGVYVVDVSYKSGILCFFIDKDGGVGIDDCEEFSRAIEIVLDKEDPIESNYSLEVSSPGVDRKLVTDREFNYYIGREVDVKLYKALDGVKEFGGVLADYREKTAYIKSGEKEIKVPVKEAAYIRLSFSF